MGSLENILKFVCIEFIKHAFMCISTGEVEEAGLAEGKLNQRALAF
jgi:hypothetical protein